MQNKKEQQAMFRITLFLIVGLLPGLISAQQTDNDAKMTAGQYKTAIFAGGCFWCVEADFDKVPGVIKTISGYIGGHTKNPTYKQVSAGGTGHTEAVQITYDPSKVSYNQLLDVFWPSIDPTARDSQFCDHGSQYRAGIFYLNAQQQKLAQASKAALEKTKPFKAPIVTEITKAGKFYAAEDYHQDYYTKNRFRYKYYRYSCGRDRRLEQLWGKAN